MLVFNGREVPVSSLSSMSFIDDPIYSFTDPRDFARRATAPTSICIHTRMGLKDQHIVPPEGRDWDQIVARRASRDRRIASWHISIDCDGSFVCHLDLLKVHAYHASQMNARSIGIEIFQDTTGGITEESLQACVLICDAITKELGIQRQFPSEKVICKRLASPKAKNKLTYVKGGREGRDYFGLFGHRNCTRNRGIGDPGDLIWDRLRDAGYEEFSIDQEEDLIAWRARQVEVGIPARQADGVPGPQTRRALIQRGYKQGLYINRPGD